MIQDVDLSSLRTCLPNVSLLSQMHFSLVIVNIIVMEFQNVDFFENCVKLCTCSLLSPACKMLKEYYEIFFISTLE